MISVFGADYAGLWLKIGCLFRLLRISRNYTIFYFIAIVGIFGLGIPHWVIGVTRREKYELLVQGVKAGRWVASYSLFSQRLRRRELLGAFSEDVELDCLRLNKKEFSRKYSTRRTMLMVDGELVDARRWYCDFGGDASHYSRFRGRLVSLRESRSITNEDLPMAALATRQDWIVYRGTRRSRRFVYGGSVFPKFYGREFASISAFLARVGRWNDRKLIWSRLKAGWSLDRAVTEPKCSPNGREGSIYRIICLPTGLSYIGLTTLKPEERLGQHCKSAASGKPGHLYTAMRKHGIDCFKLEVLESGVLSCDVVLPERERFWISELNTQWPNGYNVSCGGQVGGASGKVCEYGGKTFASNGALLEYVASLNHIEPYTAGYRLERGIPLDAPQRRVSPHPDAGTTLHRIYRGIIRRWTKSQLSDRWQTYDGFKHSIPAGYSAGLCLVRIDKGRNWSQTNCRWVTKEEKAKAGSGKRIRAFGKNYLCKADACRDFGIAVSTYNFRINKGMTPEEALSTRVGPTSHTHSGSYRVLDKTFQSVTAAARYASDELGLPFDTARDRIRRAKDLRGRLDSDGNLLPHQYRV